MEAIRQLEALWIYARLCAQAPANLPECDSFWTGAAIAAVAAVTLVALYILRQMARNFLVVRAERRRLTGGGSRMADPDTMSKYRVDNDLLYPDPPQGDVKQRIRQALDERKLGDQSRRPGTARKKESPE